MHREPTVCIWLAVWPGHRAGYKLCLSFVLLPGATYASEQAPAPASFSCPLYLPTHGYRSLKGTVLRGSFVMRGTCCVRLVCIVPGSCPDQSFSLGSSAVCLDVTLLSWLHSHSATSQEARLPRGPLPFLFPHHFPPRDSSRFLAQGWNLCLVLSCASSPGLQSSFTYVNRESGREGHHKPVPGCHGDSLMDSFPLRLVEGPFSLYLLRA